ncbi:hypothetical protein Patl1_10821 [Pistacia atlantica]|uniref:Uncharacterized protein n=1 Tax=Pistacia atlantica TaxID=434234 RepID=A0ACC1A344_9ROSI|nr:hypothetical protein Patl1_10821 [Pistacia atlantica]
MSKFKDSIEMAENEIEKVEEGQNQNHLEQKVKDIFEKAALLVTLKFEDVEHKIKSKTGRFFGSRNAKSEEKMILKGVSGAVSPGELLAILGPSGSGKTTLLTALGGRLDGDTKGTITYNGKPFSATIKRRTGFVTQINALHPHLTVNETLVFTALLRLPNSLTEKEKILHAEAVLNQLSLTWCKDTIIGGRFVKGISGGEQRRVSIGQELLINPSLLFLDEPTSGLDSTIARQILSSLWKLAKGGRTILMSIHQPSSSLFYMFNKVMLLSEGNSLYFGKGEEVMNYFASVGFVPSVAMNPSDFLLDLASGVVSGDRKEDREAVKQILVSAYQSNLSEKLKAEFQDMGNQSLKGSENKKIGKWNTSWWQQFVVLLRRDLVERRHDSFSWLKICQVLFLSVITGTLWWQSSTDNIQDHVGLLFFYSRFVGFYSFFQALRTFPIERMMIEKERASGMYRLSSYFMARTIGDIPMELTLPTLFVTLTYWMGGLKPTALSFIYTLLVSLYSALVAQSLGLAIGAVVMEQMMANTIAVTVVLIFMLAGGFLVQDIPIFLSWIQYISLAYFSYKLLLAVQYNGDETYNCAPNVTCLVRNYTRIKAIGLDHSLLSVIALTIMFLGFRFIAYIALIRFGSNRNN